MACFPRLLRKKTVFNPSHGEVFVDKSDASVQIGRYIRRDETPLTYENGRPRRRHKHKSNDRKKNDSYTNAAQISQQAPKHRTKKERRAPTRPDNILPEPENNTIHPQITSDMEHNNKTTRKQKTVEYFNSQEALKDNKPPERFHHEHEYNNENLTATKEPRTAHPKPLQTPIYLDGLKQKQYDIQPRYMDPEPNKVVIFVGGKQSSCSLESPSEWKSSGTVVKPTLKIPPEAQVEVHTYSLGPYVEEPTLPLQPQPTPAATDEALATSSMKYEYVNGGSDGVGTKNTQKTIYQQKGNKTQTKISTPQDNELQEQRNNYAKTEKPTTSLGGRDSGVQIEDTFESKESLVEAHGRVEGGVMFVRPKLSDKKNIDIEVFRKDESTRKLIRNAIEKNDFLNNYMDKDRKEMVVDAMEPATYDEGSYIIRENEEGSEIFVSEEGYYDVIKSGNIIGTIGPGTVFGELAILYSAKRFASIKAASRAKVWKIDRVKFRNIMLVSGYKEKEEYLQFLRSSPILKDLSNEVLIKLVDLLKRRFYPGNTCIVREGEVGNEFFIIRGGTVTIKKLQPDGTEIVVAHRKRGDYFGEHAILNADVRQASVYADAPVTECLKLDRETVISYLGTIPQLREKPQDTPLERVSNVRNSEFQREYADIELGDLKKVATLGAGAFGRVDLVTHTLTGRTFALKILRKIDVIKQDQIEHVYSEKQVMMMCRGSPFIIQLYKTFRNDKFVYFLMEACLGGDVWSIMSKRKFFDEKTARFIAGCVVEAFEFLHSRNIIYRDLKPENLMLNNDGYCKLVDFGFAKRILENHKTNTFAGTPEYVAPEIILDRGHDKSVDYWALGILIFELLVGKSPFRGQNQIKIYQQILGGIDVIQMPSRIPKTAQGLIKHLCKQMPAERLGYQRKGIADIKRHSWFDGFDWKRLKAKTLPSPIKRPISGNTDLQYFDPCCGGDNDEPPDETSGWDMDF